MLICTDIKKGGDNIKLFKIYDKDSKLVLQKRFSDTKKVRQYLQDNNYFGKYLITRMQLNGDPIITTCNIKKENKIK